MKKSMKMICAGLAIIGGWHIGALSVWAQGSLEPSGAPAPGLKTLEQIESRTPISSLPCVINTSGSYYLTGDLTCASPTGIYITATSVTLDLNGYTLTGPGASAMYGIRVYPPNRVFTVSNGQLRNWGGSSYGIHAFSSYAVTVSDITIESCGSYGFYLKNGTLRNCVVANSTADAGNFFGFYVNSMVMQDCMVNNSESVSGSVIGFDMNGSIARNCIAYGLTAANNSLGFQGQNGSLIEGCVARGCDFGIYAHNKTFARNNICADNADAGIFVFYRGNRIEGNHLIANRDGLYSTGNATNLIVANSACISSNSNFVITRGVYGPIQDGVTSTSVVVTNQAWGNFEY